MESNDTQTAKLVDWYRCPIEKEQLKKLYERSDLKGLAQAGGYLLLVIGLGAAVLYSAHHFLWPFTVLLIFVYGTVFAFMPAAVHETGHYTTFKSKWLSTLFVSIFGFLGWLNYRMFELSHTRHHRSTLHPPDDLEVVLPIKPTIKSQLQAGIVSPLGLKYLFLLHLRYSRGIFLGEWENKICPESSPERRRWVISFSRAILIGHAVIFIGALCLKLWLIPVLITFGPFYGAWLANLIGTTQHAGLSDNTNDFRICCRTVLVNPILQFLYFHMNYHIEHHMYVGVPCYNLGKLHRLIASDSPEPRRGVIAAWKEMLAIVDRQNTEPEYQYRTPLPATAHAAPVEIPA